MPGSLETVVVTTTPVPPSQAEQLFDIYAGVASRFATDDVRAQFRMFERLVVTDTGRLRYRQRCVEELLPEGSQQSPIWAGYVVAPYFGDMSQVEKEVLDSNGNAFVLQVHDRRLRVVGAGSDGEIGTKDDDIYPDWLRDRAWVFDRRPRRSGR